MNDRHEQDWVHSAEIGGRNLAAFHQLRRMAAHEQGHWEQIPSFSLDMRKSIWLSDPHGLED
jgi:hypothetical protein